MISLARPLNGLIAAFAVAVGVKLGGGAEAWRWLLASVSAAFLISWANIHNDLLDLEADKINRPHRPLPSGEATPRQAKGGLWAFGLLSALGFSVGLRPGLIYGLAWILIYLYNRWLKRLPLLGNLTVAAVGGMGFLYGGLVGGGLLAPLWAALLAGSYHLFREVVKSLEDREGDASAGRRTIAVVAPGFARAFAFGLGLGCAGLMPVPYILGVYAGGYVLVVGVFVVPLVIVSAALALAGRFLWAQRLAKAGMPLAIVALYFGV